MTILKRIYNNFKVHGFKKTLRDKSRIYFKNFFLNISKNRKIYFPDQKRFKKIKIDTTNYYSEMCDLSLKYDTDKSPYNQKSLRHAYTGVYHLLFNRVKNQNLNICELGILKNESIKLLRDYFPNATIFGFDNEINLIQKAKTDNLEKTTYNLINVKEDLNLINVFNKLDKQFDIIIDDSTHVFDDQIRIIKCLHKFMKPGGTMFIEDIYQEYKEEDYFLSLKNFISHFKEIYFVETEHKNNFSPLWKNNKILILEK